MSSFVKPGYSALFVSICFTVQVKSLYSVYAWFKLLSKQLAESLLFTNHDHQDKTRTSWDLAIIYSSVYGHAWSTCIKDDINCFRICKVKGLKSLPHLSCGCLVLYITPNERNKARTNNYSGGKRNSQFHGPACDNGQYMQIQEKGNDIWETAETSYFSRKCKINKNFERLFNSPTFPLRVLIHRKWIRWKFITFPTASRYWKDKNNFDANSIFSSSRKAKDVRLSV